jgi:GNAT superfamily N-acetyltransferase
MGLKILPVPNTPEGRHDAAPLLLDLQLTILPADKPAATSVGCWWVVYDGDKPVGFAGMYRSRRWGDAGYLCRSGILPAYRGRGLQKRLIRVRERKARKAGMTWLISDTYENPPSANSLISCGYKTYQPVAPWAGDGTTYWRKKL